MEENDEFETDAEADEVDVNVEFDNEIPAEPLVPPAKPVSRIRKLSFSFVALLLVLVGLINLAIIIWTLLR